MRNLEFRVWNKDYNRFVNLEDDFENWSLNLGSGSITLTQNCSDGVFSDQNVVLQQFTGLFDKNGRKIFEGDIIKECHFEDWGDKEGFEYFGVVEHGTYQVDFGNSFSGFVTFPNLEEPHEYSGNPIKSDCEVVGNVFENGDLIK